MKKLLMTLLIALLPLLAVGQGRITSGDTLTITIKGVPQEEQAQINGMYPVTSSGRIKIPYIDGYIAANGRSAEAVARSIEGAYKSAKIYNNPTISITFENLKKQQDEIDRVKKFVTLSGELGRPGPIPYRPGMTLNEAVFSGAPTTFGATNRVELLRNGKKYKYDMRNAQHMMLKVYPNDQIKVPQKNWRGQ